MEKLWEHVFPCLLQLACDVEQVNYLYKQYFKLVSHMKGHPPKIWENWTRTGFTLCVKLTVEPLGPIIVSLC